jgi:hypothetical protein
MDEGDTVGPEQIGDEHSLRTAVEQSEHVLAELERDLQAVDCELEALAQRNRHYDVVRQVCASLEELESAGARHLFWDEQAAPDLASSCLQHARRNIDGFAVEVAEVESHRHAIVEKINRQNQNLDFLHYDLRDAIEHEESRQAEWIVEREVGTLPYHTQVMPWARGFEEDRRFRRNLGASVLASLLVWLLTMVVELPIPLRSELTEVPERVAQLLRQETQRPSPPVVVEEPPAPDEIAEPEPELAETEPPENLPESTDEPQVAEVRPEDAREQVKSKGILAFRDSFASRANLNPTAQLGSQARVRTAGEEAIGRPQRSMVTTSAPGSSGGINLADLSRDVGGGGQAIGGVAVTRVASSIGGDGGVDRPLSSGASAGRTDEEIQIVFDRYKAALYRLYNRELRKDPTLRGQLVLRLTIEPDGTVSLCNLQSSDMDAPELADQVVDRVRAFDFGAKEGIVAMTIVYPIDFLPAA